jgi:alkylation response protein AidB-like acyl-CoA dehydrogenase
MTVVDTVPVAAEQDETRTALLSAVERVRPILEANADDAEREGTLPEPAWRALHDAGLFRLKAPRALGGFEADPTTQIEVIEAVSYIDTSAAWTMMIGAGGLSGISPWLDDQGIEAVMVEGRLPRVAGALMPGGPAVREDGGYRVRGRWQFASGSEHAEWFFGTAIVAGEDPPGRVGCLFRRAAVTLHDNWHVGGLKGTGSQDFSVEDVFVPDYLTLDLGAPAKRGGPLYSLGIPGLVINEFIGFALGAARRSVDEMTALAKSKTRGYFIPQGVAARGAFQLDLGRADLQLQAARAGALDTWRRVWALVVEGQPPDVATQVELRAVSLYATDVAIEVCERMFRHAGARSLFSGNVIERNLRDVLAAAQHNMVSDVAYELHGRVMLGFEDVVPMS